MYGLIWVYTFLCLGSMNFFSVVVDSPGGIFCVIQQDSWKVAVYVTFFGYLPGIGTAFFCYLAVYRNLLGNSRLIGVRPNSSQDFHAKVAKKVRGWGAVG